MREVHTSPHSALELITDWHSLGAYLDIPTNIMSWVLRERSSMQRRIRIGDRTVFKSDDYLRGIQAKLEILCDEIFESLPDTDCVLAYRKGRTASDVIVEMPHSEMLILFDIKKYYDNITVQHITDALMHHGIPELGARLIARYCVVKTKGRETLQQGSPASPALSNLVGYYNFDQPIKAWLAVNGNEKIRYIRYCDNIALFCEEAPEAEFINKFKEFVRTELESRGFRTHKWDCISDTNPAKNQRFLGIVLNAQARVEIAVVDSLRAFLFNWARNGWRSCSLKFLRERGVMNITAGTIDYHKTRTKALQYANGHIAYITRISEKQGKMLKKLLEAAKLLDSSGKMTSTKIFNSIKKYRNHAETVEEYLEHLRTAVETSA